MSRSGLRGTLFRKYAAYFAGLVSVALLASGLTGLYFDLVPGRFRRISGFPARACFSTAANVVAGGGELLAVHLDRLAGADLLDPPGTMYADICRGNPAWERFATGAPSGSSA